jgi:hypothetical protein
MAKRTLTLSAEKISFAYTQGDVLIVLDLAESSAGLVPELDLAIRLSPAESRSFARVLERKADEAEGLTH